VKVKTCWLLDSQHAGVGLDETILASIEISSRPQPCLKYRKTHTQEMMQKNSI